jgi:transposase
MQVSLRQPEDLEVLKRRIRLERHATQRDRYRAVRWALAGKSSSWIAAKLERCGRFVQKWAYAYRDGGIDAIAEQPRSGAPTKLSPDQEDAFKKRLNAGPTEADGGVCTLRGKDVVRILEQEFGACYGLQGAYDLLHRLGYACLKPRPKHRKNDPQAMAAWQQDTPL